MAKPCKIGLREIRELRPGEELRDTVVRGFRARRQNSPAVSYSVLCRPPGGKLERLTIGRHGAPWTPDEARKEALRLLGRMASGEDPAKAKRETRKAPTVAELCEQYLDDARAGRLISRRSKKPKKASTVDGDRGRIERHIVPLLGHLKVDAVTKEDIERFYDAVSEGATAATVKTGQRGLARVTGGRGTATRALGLLGPIFKYAIDKKLRSDNPTIGIMKHAYNERDRRVSDSEYAALGAALRSMPKTTWPPAVALTSFLAISGWRRGEALALRWVDVDLATRTARLPDTKTGKSLRALPQAACDVLRDLPRLGDLVFPSSDGGKRMAGYHKVWLRIAAKACLSSDVTPHVLRHSFASVAADLGFSELTIAALLGHRKATVTSRYAHHADAVLLAAADTVAAHIETLMRAEPAQ